MVTSRRIRRAFGSQGRDLAGEGDSSRIIEFAKEHEIVECTDRVSQ